jgi:hypothetical protein
MTQHSTQYARLGWLGAALLPWLILVAGSILQHAR